MSNIIDPYISFESVEIIPPDYQDAAEFMQSWYEQDDISSGVWANSGLTSGLDMTFDATNTPTYDGANHRVNFNSSGSGQYMEGDTIDNDNDGNYVMSVVFSVSSLASLNTIMELRSNRNLVIGTDGKITVQSSAVSTTSGAIEIDTEYALIAELTYTDGSTNNVRVKVCKVSDGSTVLDENLTGHNGFGLLGTTGRIGADTGGNPKFGGYMKKVGVHGSTLTTDQFDDLMLNLLAAV